jgi:O-antigen ligase
VPFTTAGRGQLQGGLYFFPLAVIMSFAALVSGGVQRTWRPAVWAVLALNSMCLLFTYERTFWAAAVLGCAFVLLREGAVGRRRALTVVPLAAAALVLVLGATSPNDLVAAGERLLSVTQFKTDDSVEYRQIESAAVLRAVEDRPLIGHGFGAAITWKLISSGTNATTTFAHNGYLWLVWKAGLLVALLVVAGLLWSVARRSGAYGPSMPAVLRRGAQGALLGLLLVNVTFPSFNHLGIGVVTGLLVALCWRSSAHAAA